MIETERLLLRRWREEDVEPHYRLVNHPAIVRTLGGPPNRAASEEVVTRQNGILDANGSCFWAVEHRATGRFIGWCGIKPGSDPTPIAHLSEIGWTIDPAFWRQGLAREVATAVLAWAWTHTDHGRIHAITTPGNTASWGLMERLGMTRLADGDFNHPALPPGDPLRPHITYAITRPA